MSQAETRSRFGNPGWFELIAVVIMLLAGMIPTAVEIVAVLAIIFTIALGPIVVGLTWLAFDGQTPPILAR